MSVQPQGRGPTILEGLIQVFMCRLNRLDEPILMTCLKPLQQAFLLNANV